MMIKYASVTMLQLNCQRARLVMCDLGVLLCEKAVSVALLQDVICGSEQSVWFADPHERVCE